MSREKRLHIVGKPGLQSMAIGQAVTFHASLTTRTIFPEHHVYLIATNVYVWRGKEVEQFGPHIATKLQHAVVTQT